jgi:aerobic carbon-monoxide dehydrogenase large subunit
VTMPSVKQPPTWIGQSVPRVEDPPLLTGNTRFVDDIEPGGVLHASFVRSQYPAARLEGIQVEGARSVAGVEAVFTAADVGGGLRAMLNRPEFTPTVMPLLASDAVRHVGEPIAVVLADSRYSAEDGAEEVIVDYEPNEAISSIDRALAAGGARVHADMDHNLLLDVPMYDDPELDHILSTAALVLDASYEAGRVTAVPMEGRGAVAEWDPREDRLNLYVSTQLPHLVRTTVADVVGIPEHKVRVIAPDVGGGFGLKCVVGREEVLIAALACRLRRSVKWIEDRQENLAASFHGHEQRYDARAAFDAGGTLVGLSVDIFCDVGAYSCFPFSCGVEPLMAATEMPGPYRVRHYRARARAVATNKAPIAPYRGVSRPQITFVMERLMHKAAVRLDLGPVEVRRRNLIGSDEFPYTGITGLVYDPGSYRESLDLCATKLEHDSWKQRQEAARRDGRLLGLGLSCFSERTGYGTPAFAQRKMEITPGFDSAEIRMDPSGSVTVTVGTSGHGQGHRTTLAQIVADELAIDPSYVRVIQGDTDQTPYGWGTFASRSTVIGGGAAKLAAAQLGERLKRIAGHLLEVAADDIELEFGRLQVRGAPDVGLSVSELARIAHHSAYRLPELQEAGLQTRAGFDPPGTFSNATHGAVVEVSAETGEVRIDRYVVVEDCGVVINPMIVDGQVRGGVAQGIAAALYEELLYDEDGQLLTATLMDYLVPTAAEIPSIEIHHLETPCAYTETGAKGMGEGGTIGAPAAVANAVADAVAHMGIEIDRIPITPAWLLGEIEAATQR